MKPQTVLLCRKERCPYRVFERHEAVAHPAAGRPVSADVGEGFVVVSVRSTERHLLYGLVHDEVLNRNAEETYFGFQFSTWFSRCLILVAFVKPL